MVGRPTRSYQPPLKKCVDPQYYTDAINSFHTQHDQAYVVHVSVSLAHNLISSSSTHRAVPNCLGVVPYIQFDAENLEIKLALENKPSTL
mmetsp:Transcript_8536/g.18470  ORF Transcript_8536/g.18470 Transcript_8536/m.18470 type:complete len:90 (-) Transcript_8536:741-1010(-)